MTTHQPQVNSIIPLNLWQENRLNVEPGEYNGSCVKWNKLANFQLRNSDTIILSGYGCQLKVRDDALCVDYEQGHIPGRQKVLKLDRGTHKTKQLIICSHAGYITLDAIQWASQQGITIFLLNWKNEVVSVLTPRQARNARLIYLQYGASQNKQGVEIAKELIRLKTLAQVETLKSLPSYKQSKRLISEQFEYSLKKLPTLKNIEAIHILEAHSAIPYWSSLAGIPIRWKIPDLKRIPAHWQAITERSSDISSFHNGSQAVNPFHAVLNFSYALLKAQVLQSILVAGLDESVGFLHSSQESQQALVHDVMEAFRPTIDSMVLSLFSKQVFAKGDFVQAQTGECQMNEELRRYVLSLCHISDTHIDALVRWLRDTLDA